MDIDRLDETWARSRGAAGRTPDIHGLAEVLRTIGRYFDAEGARLDRIVKETRRVEVRFRDAQGKMRVQECSLMDLYRKQQDLISARGALRFEDIWKSYDL